MKEKDITIENNNGTFIITIANDNTIINKNNRHYYDQKLLKEITLCPIDRTLQNFYDVFYNHKKTFIQTVLWTDKVLNPLYLLL